MTSRTTHSLQASGIDNSAKCNTCSFVMDANVFGIVAAYSSVGLPFRNRSTSFVFADESPTEAAAASAAAVEEDANVILATRAWRSSWRDEPNTTDHDVARHDDGRDNGGRWRWER